MKLRFEVDQAECLRRGIDAPKSIVHIEVDPASLPQEDRDLIADRLLGIDVWRLDGAREKELPERREGVPTPAWIIAKAPTYEAMMEAIRENDSGIKPRSVGNTLVNAQVLADVREQPKDCK